METGYYAIEALNTSIQINSSYRYDLYDYIESIDSKKQFNNNLVAYITQKALTYLASNTQDVGKAKAILNELALTINQTNYSITRKLNLLTATMSRLQHLQLPARSLAPIMMQLQRFAINCAIAMDDPAAIDKCLKYTRPNSSSIFAIARWAAYSKDQTLMFKQLGNQILSYKHLTNDQMIHLFYLAAQYGNTALLKPLSHFISDYFVDRKNYYRDLKPEPAWQKAEQDCYSILANFVGLAIYNGHFELSLSALELFDKRDLKACYTNSYYLLISPYNLIQAISQNNRAMIRCLATLVFHTSYTDDVKRKTRKRLQMLAQHIEQIPEAYVACALDCDEHLHDSNYSLTQLVTECFCLNTDCDAIFKHKSQSQNNHSLAKQYLRYQCNITEVLCRAISLREWPCANVLIKKSRPLSKDEVNRLAQAIINYRQPSRKAYNRILFGFMQFLASSLPIHQSKFRADTARAYASIFINQNKPNNLIHSLQRSTKLNPKQVQMLLKASYHQVKNASSPIPHYLPPAKQNGLEVFCILLGYSQKHLHTKPHYWYELIEQAIVDKHKALLGIMKYYLEARLPYQDRQRLNQLAKRYVVPLEFDCEASLPMQALQTQHDNTVSNPITFDYKNYLIDFDHSMNTCLRLILDCRTRYTISQYQVFALICQLKADCKMNHPTSLLRLKQLIQDTSTNLLDYQAKSPTDIELTNLIQNDLVVFLAEQQLTLAFTLANHCQTQEIVKIASLVFDNITNLIKKNAQLHVTNLLSNFVIWLARQPDAQNYLHILNHHVFTTLSNEAIWPIWHLLASEGHSQINEHLIDLLKVKEAQLIHPQYSMQQLHNFQSHCQTQLGKIIYQGLYHNQSAFVINLLITLPTSLQPNTIDNYQLLGLDCLHKAIDQGNSLHVQCLGQLLANKSYLIPTYQAQLDSISSVINDQATSILPEKIILKALKFDQDHHDTFKLTQTLLDARPDWATPLSYKLNYIECEGVDLIHQLRMIINKQVSCETSASYSSTIKDTSDSEYALKLISQALNNQDHEFACMITDHHVLTNDSFNTLANNLHKNNFSNIINYLSYLLERQPQLQFSLHNAFSYAKHAIQIGANNFLQQIFKHSQLLDKYDDTKDDFLSLSGLALDKYQYDSLSILLWHNKHQLSEENDNLTLLIDEAIDKQDKTALGILSYYSRPILEHNQKDRLDQKAKNKGLEYLFSNRFNQFLTQQAYEQAVEFESIKPNSAY